MKQVPHVLHLVNSFKQGGSEQQAVQLIRLLHETGRYRIFVAVQNGVGPLRHEIENLPPSELVEFPLSSFHDRKAIGQWRRFRRYVREHRIDIVQTHDFYTNIFGLFGAAISGVPVRVASRRETTGTRSRAQKLVERASFRFADAIVANSEAVRTQLVREGIRQQKISVIYNGVDVRSMTVEPGFDRARALTRLHLPVSPQFQFVTLLANMRLKVKDHPMFLRAAKAVAETLPDARFVLAGEGELTDALRTAAREMGIADKVCFVGECSRVVELLAVSDVCVLSSKAEGLSNSILE